METFTEALELFPNIENGVTPTSLSNVNFFQQTTHKISQPTDYHAGIVILFSGKKIMHFAEQEFIYNAKEYVVSSMLLHAQCETCATLEEPVKGIFVGFTQEQLRELIALMNLQTQNSPFEHETIGSSIGISQMTPEFKESVLRLLKCLQHEDEVKILGEGLKRELIYRALCGEQRDLLLKLALPSAPISQISKVISFLEANYSNDINIDDLAKSANMSPSSFYRVFKEVTSDSPNQYLKKLRLNKARDLIIQKNVKAYIAALEVGYQSPSHFNREFKRFFGSTPATLKSF